MTFQITVQPSGHKFDCEQDETVLAAAIRAGIGLPYGCKNGACGSCKGKVIEGTVTHRAHQQRALSEQEAADGFSLFCCATTSADLVIEAREVAGSSEYPVRKMPSRVAKLEKVAPDVIVMSLQLPANEALAYRAGQYIEFMLKDGKRRSYSMANAPSTLDAPLQLHIRYMAGGLFTEHVFNTMKERDILRFEGPHGDFFLREGSAKPIILVAGGTGFAPIKSVVEHALHNRMERTMILYWGARDRAGLYLPELPRQWAAAHPHFRYVPVIEQGYRDGERHGLVHQAVLEDFPDLSDHQVYACGAPLMIDAARRDFVAHGLEEEEFFADVFSFAVDAKATT